ncbi:MAG TPA: tetratricopeptide repeat protein [Candidatus Paceibacterota bacterium]|jgi:tetratricopeptide (TPR) repeat protein|nr:hypothetical protein [Parcubacteria group bacterium]MDP6119437.1 tetratricopeptide repeat protein [Candidatus Paceibacterota bacterium]HJN62685.1 tetratricopeptide repeat protein [Candidatus Paceibacterota bacterium]|tara:strand:+ start:5767 stop:8148 length:2382 start_codon:yes stop_codon:yes gene_type:complete
MEYNLSDQQSNLQNKVPKLSAGKIENLSFYVILILSFLLPIFLVPSIIFPFQLGKIFLVGVGVILAFTLWIIAQLRAGSLELPRSFVFYLAGLVLILGFISTLFSGAIFESFIGVGGETSTYFFFLILFLLLFTSFKVFNSSRRVIRLYLISILSFTILIIYQLLRVFVGADFLDFGILNSTTSTLAGKWGDLAILLGLSTLVSVMALQFFSITGLKRVLLYIFMFLSLFIVLIVNSLLSWIVIGISSLLLFIYFYFQGRNEETEGVSKKKIAKLPIILFILSILFILMRGNIGDFVSNQYDISRVDARPNFFSTLNIAKGALMQSPGFGSGLNRFNIEWGLNKPLSVNNTIFWDTNFNYGIGVIPTFLVTNGILGFASWVIFLILLFTLGIRVLFKNLKDSRSKFIILSSFLSAGYLWTFSIVSVPGSVVLTATFLMTGVLLASISREGFIEHKKISFSGESKAGFVSVFLLVLILILNAGFAYMMYARYISSVYASKSLTDVNLNNDLDSGLRNINKAISLSKTDENYRLASQLHIMRLSNLLNEEDLAGTEEGITKFQEILGTAISRAEAATNADEADYRNWVSLGNIYEAIIPLGIQGAYESAKRTYERASEANPTNPSPDLALARLEVQNGDNDSARVNINNSLQKKNNYTEAIFLLSQIEINEGNIKEATKAVEAASLINPNDSLVFFQLGFLQFNQSDYEAAIQSLERAVVLNPPYSNAKYFLGLSYYGVDRLEEAVQQFEDIKVLNPDNQEVELILDNLKSGNPPLLNVGPPAPEDREELPVDEL